MSERITMRTTGADATVVKRATGSARRAALAAEAALLQSLDHPGIARFVDHRTGDHHDELETVLAGSVTLADLPPRDISGAAGVLAAVAGIVADLHASGVAHGAIQADHVVLGGHRHPVLCSFGAATRSVDDQHRDVLALGRLATELADGLTDGGRRQLRKLRAAAAAASAGEIDALEFSRRCASIPDAKVPAAVAAPPTPSIERPAPAAGGTRAWRHRVVSADDAAPTLSRTARIGAVVVVASLTGLVVWSGLERSGPRPALVVDASPPAPTIAVGVGSIERPPAAEPPPAPTCAATPDVDGDGCADDVEVIGSTIRVGDDWFVAGEEGDVVVVGHWYCSPVATPAVLRPRTGELFVFDGWPAGAEDAVRASAVGTQPGATGLAAEVVDGCERPTPTVEDA